MPLNPLEHLHAMRRIRQVARPPVVIGATGGSGTRMVHGVLEKAGLFMGAPEKLNHAGDAMEIEPLLDNVINPILAATGSLDYEVAGLPPSLAASARSELACSVDRFLRDLPDKTTRWGWKNPRSMYVLPLIADLFPEARFIHLVRDGRDMATSDNQNQPRKHYRALFGTEPKTSDPNASIQLWMAANLGAAAWGERNLGSNYLRVRFEDLCANPEYGVETILRFVGYSHEEMRPILNTARETIAPPATINRWHSLDRETADTLTGKAAKALGYFGYAEQRA
jgi:hypothetical protein